MARDGSVAEVSERPAIGSVFRTDDAGASWHCISRGHATSKVWALYLTGSGAAVQPIVLAQQETAPIPLLGGAAQGTLIALVAALGAAAIALRSVPLRSRRRR